jgi:ribosomal protein S12
MARAPSVLILRALRSFILPTRPIHSPARLAVPLHATRIIFPKSPIRSFSTTPSNLTTLNQVRNGCRKPQKKRRSLSPAMVGRPEMKGVCLKVGITKPKKPNSGQRKTAKVRLSSGRIISAYIPGEGALKKNLDKTKTSWLTRWSRSQCPTTQRSAGPRRTIAGLPRCALPSRQGLNGSCMCCLAHSHFPIRTLLINCQGGVPNRIRSRSKYGTKKPKAAA